jgi:hypothetical protein
VCLFALAMGYPSSVVCFMCVVTGSVSDSTVRIAHAYVCLRSSSVACSPFGVRYGYSGCTPVSLSSLPHVFLWHGISKGQTSNIDNTAFQCFLAF